MKQLKLDKWLLTAFLGVSFLFSSRAQSPLYYTGYGRALVGNSQYQSGSNFIKDDTVSNKKALDGNFVFDLGINLKANEQLKANAILRVSNEFGGFYSSGSLLEFRQIQIEGTLARKLSYNLGDLDLAMTKYTLYNNDEPTYSEFEAQAFKIRRDIVSYDNFNTGNKWRLQGAQAGTSLKFNKGIERISFNGFATRIIPSNFLNTPDRLLLGGTVKVRQSKFFELGGHVIALTDVAGTVRDTVIFYQNQVFTAEAKGSYTTRTWKFALQTELGRSFYNRYLQDSDLRVKNFDGYFDAALQTAHKYIPFSASLAYRIVGPEFSSPGAQTRRVFDDQSGLLLPEGQSGTAIRAQHLFDRMSDLNLYNRSLSTTFMYFNPVYNNATPYGQATPNRKGLTLEARYGHKDSLVYANLQAQWLSEVLGVGINTKRQFIILQPGVTINAHRLIGFRKLMAVSTSLRYENTQGSENAGIAFTSMMLDAGLTLEVLNNFDLMGGVKMLSAKGDEVFALRNGFNQIINYQLFSADIKQQAATFGLRYRFTNQIFFSANAYLTGHKDELTSTQSYNIGQYFFSYVMKF